MSGAEVVQITHNQCSFGISLSMGVSPSSSQITRSHYLKSFGPFNQLIDIRNHSFILLDAPGLVDEDYQRSAYGVGFDKWKAIPEGVVSFVKTVERGKILISSQSTRNVLIGLLQTGIR